MSQVHVFLTNNIINDKQGRVGNRLNQKKKNLLTLKYSLTDKGEQSYFCS